MENLGKANAQVMILTGLPGVDKNAGKFNFDVSAYSYQMLLNSPYFSPLLTEQVHDEEETFAACYPSKRKNYVDNYLSTSIPASTSPEAEKPYIVFTPVATKEGIFKDIVEKNDPPYTPYELILPDKYETVLPTYVGPKWYQSPVNGLSIPNDELTLETWKSLMESTGSDTLPPLEVNTPELGVPKTQYIFQAKEADGLWWAIQSKDFLKRNMPFWVSLNISRTPPTSTHTTAFVISLGVTGGGNTQNPQCYDILIGQNVRPRIIDYYKGRPSGDNDIDYGDQPPPSVEFPVDFSRIWDSEDEINIGIMTIAGRLVVHVQDVPLIYTRVSKSSGDEGGTILEAQIPEGAIRISGTNVQANINVCPMVFADASILALPIPSIKDNQSNETTIEYKGVTNHGEFQGPVCLLSQQPDKPGVLYGVDCKTFRGEGGESANPSGIGFHQQGSMSFMKAKSAGLASLPDSDFYVLVMIPENVTWQQTTLKKGGCPYFFRLKGGAKLPTTEQGVEGTPVYDVLSVSQSTTAPDYFHCISTATVELYNPNGQYDYLKETQYGITIAFGWNEESIQTFTGVVINTTKNETPGKETITLQCSDYMQILKDVPIVNSPFYDGMVGYYAIEDLAGRGGMLSFEKDWDDNEDDYFLPSGYAFTQPAVKFEGQQKIFECIIEIVKRFEAFVYFDGYGNFHIAKLPGGLLSESAETTPAADFVRDPTAPVDLVILDQKNAAYSFIDPVNRISALTLDRDTRNAIFYTRSAEGDEDHLAYRKVTLLNQAALGDIESCRKWVEELAKRMFWPIRDTSFTTTGAGATLPNVFDFVTVDSMEYRLMAVNRKYGASDNSFTNEYQAEWLGGK